MDIKTIIAEMEVARQVTIVAKSYIGNGDAMEKAKKEAEANILKLGESLYDFSRTELYNEYKSLRGTMTMASPLSELTVDVLVQRIINYFVSMIIVSVEVPEPTGFTLFIEGEDFYRKLQSLLDNRHTMDIEENLNSQNIDFVRNDCLFISPTG